MCPRREESFCKGCGFSCCCLLIVTLMIQEGQSYVGAPCHQQPQPGAQPRLSGAGSPRPGNTTCTPPGRRGLPLTRPQSIQGEWERGVQTLSHPHQMVRQQPPWAVLSTGTWGLGGGSSPEGLQGLLSHPGAFTSQTGPGISPPAQLRALFNFYLRFYGRTAGALWAVGHPCYDARQCIFHEHVSVRLVGVK